MGGNNGISTPLLYQQKIKQIEKIMEIGKIPPQAVDAENDLIGHLLLYSESLDTVSKYISPDSFYNENNSIIYQSICNVRNANNNVDLLSVTEDLKKSGRLEYVGGRLAIAQLTMQATAAFNGEYAAMIIKQNAIKRDIIGHCSKIMTSAYDMTVDVKDAIGQLNEAYEDINQELSRNAEIKNYREIAEAAYQETKERKAKKDSGISVGIPTGFEDIDEGNGGYQDAELTIIAARPSMGKSAVMLKSIKTAAMAGYNVVVFSLEMMAEKLVSRDICGDIGVEPRKALNGSISNSELVNFENVAKTKNVSLKIDDRTKSIEEICSLSRVLKRKGQLDILFIDYLQLITTNENLSVREQYVASIMRKIVSLKKELNIPIILLAQLNRDTAGNGQLPHLKDLRESGSIEQDADNVYFIHRPHYYSGNDSDLGKMLICIRKQRNGQQFANLAYEHNEEMTKFWKEGDKYKTEIQKPISYEDSKEFETEMDPF